MLETRHYPASGLPFFFYIPLSGTRPRRYWQHGASHDNNHSTITFSRVSCFSSRRTSKPLPSFPTDQWPQGSIPVSSRQKPFDFYRAYLGSAPHLAAGRLSSDSAMITITLSRSPRRKKKTQRNTTVLLYCTHFYSGSNPRTSVYCRRRDAGVVSSTIGAQWLTQQASRPRFYNQGAPGGY